MKRRDFLKHSSVTLPFSAVFLQSISAAATDAGTDWIDIPGTDGRLQLKNLFAVDKAQCRLFKLAAGFPVGPHIHPAGEYTYMVEGSFEFETQTFKKADYLYMEPGTTHPAGKAGPDGAIIFVFTPEPIVRL